MADMNFAIMNTSTSVTQECNSIYRLRWTIWRIVNSSLSNILTTDWWT